LITNPNEEDLDASMKICPECKCMFHRWEHMRSFSAPSLSSLVVEPGFAIDVCQGLKFKHSGRRAASLVEWLQDVYRNICQLPSNSLHQICM
jgi:hypothetical protein